MEDQGKVEDRSEGGGLWNEWEATDCYFDPRTGEGLNRTERLHKDELGSRFSNEGDEREVVVV
ncbi:hypothetical protein QJS10_CPB17g00654 [Acorus calamus]|uniref:Uncharacterized protein n=1 Tax=Acorus calamus TaxID=4465 RepID=A0AAV9CU30_ACOCL|nr:hypothetical protein QJS10_CPB17g00654 [Acorus calamus]